MRVALLVAAGVALRCSVALGQPAGGVPRYSPREAETTLAQVHAAVVTFHPRAYEPGGRAAIDTAFERAGERLAALAGPRGDDSVARALVVATIADAARVLGDGHFQLRYLPRPAVEARYRYDLATARLDDGRLVLRDSLYVADSATLYSPGVEVFAIDGRPVGPLIELLSRGGGLDDHDMARARAEPPSRYPLRYYQRAFGWRDSLSVALGPYRGRPADTAWLYPRSFPPEAPPRARRRRGTRRRSRAARLADNLRLDTTRLPGVYELDIRTFSRGRFRGVNEFKAVNRAFARLEAEDARALVIDVRGNTGGQLSLVSRVFAHVADGAYRTYDDVVAYHPRARGRTWRERALRYVFGGVRERDGVYVQRRGRRSPRVREPSRRHRFRGPVVVLVNEVSFSGATLLAHLVQQAQRGVVVGQPPGGSAERMYASVLFPIPVGRDGELTVNMPLWRMDMPGETRGNVVPDVIVPRRLADVRDGRDAALEIGLGLIERWLRLAPGATPD